MKSLPYAILSIMLLAFLISCRHTNNSEDKPIEEEQEERNDYLGVWHSVKRDYPFGADLTIDSNYRFLYKGGACVGRFRSEGIWILRGDTLVLNSIKPEECHYISEFGINCIVVSSPDERLERETSEKGCVPETHYEYIVFKNERFIIKDSVLTHFPKPKNPCPESRDDFTKDWSD